MKKYLLKVEVEPLEEGGYLAICPDLQGCHAEGETVAEALYNLEDVARIIIEFCMEKGFPLPPEMKDYESKAVIKAEVVVGAGA